MIAPSGRRFLVGGAGGGSGGEGSGGTGSSFAGIRSSSLPVPFAAARISGTSEGEGEEGAEVGEDGEDGTDGEEGDSAGVSMSAGGAELVGVLVGSGVSGIEYFSERTPSYVESFGWQDISLLQKWV